jgi:hypothetical protein
MTQQHLNEVKRECFAEVIKFADELEDEGLKCRIARNPLSVSIVVYKQKDYRFFFIFDEYDTTLEAGQEFHKQFNKFKISCKNKES